MRSKSEGSVPCRLSTLHDRGPSFQIDDDIAIWWFAIDGVPNNWGILAHDEIARVGRINAVEHQVQFVSSHVATRMILSTYTGCDPKRLTFKKGIYGKPSLEGPGEVMFSLAHSNSIATLAVTHRGEVGVDCEQVVPIREIVEICARICSPIEVLLMRQSGYDLNLFYRIWTGKEAFVKAVGIGLGVQLSAITVLQHAEDLEACVESPTWGNWWVSSISAPQGYAGACCTERRSHIRYIGQDNRRINCIADVNLIATANSIS